MRAISLLAVFAVAKLAMLDGRALSPTAWSAVAYFWQDVLVALLLGLCAARVRTTRHASRVIALIYWTAAIYAAANIPVGRALSTPLTWPMLRAARGPLADSFLMYLTVSNLLLVAMTIAVAVAVPWTLRRLPRRAPHMAATCGVFIVAVGPIASARVDTHGFDRNVIVALVASGQPQVRSHPANSDWRSSPFKDSGRVTEFPAAIDLSVYRGAARGRNVVLVSLESTAAQYLLPFGSDDDPMPALTALARNAVVFESAYAAYPESIKGLFSILCSTFPAFDVPAEAYGGVPCQSLAEVLGAAGYVSGMFHSGRFAYLGMESIVRNAGYDALEDAGQIGGDHESSFGVDEPSTVAQILSWIDSLPRDRPFFLTYLPIAGHHPYDTPAHGVPGSVFSGGVFSENDEFGRYRNALRYGDASLDVLVKAFRARGLEDNTLWIILGDHGEAFGQHEGNYAHTFHLYDENVRVPFVVAAPGLTKGQTRVRQVVSLVDTAPTILELVGLPIPADYQGRTMLSDAPGMALFFTDYSLALVGLRDGRWKFINELGTGRSRLFDLATDPAETVDVSARLDIRSATYRKVLLDWTGAQKSYLLERTKVER